MVVRLKPIIVVSIFFSIPKFPSIHRPAWGQRVEHNFLSLHRGYHPGPQTALAWLLKALYSMGLIFRIHARMDTSYIIPMHNAESQSPIFGRALY